LAPACAPTARATSLPEAGAGILITRPEPGASETAARLAARGLRAIVAPVLEIRRLPGRLPPPAHLQAIVIASGNAVPALPATHRHLPLMAVGEATASRARAAGFVRVTSADGDAGALAALAARSCDSKAAPLLLATGSGQGKALAADLRTRGFRVIRRAVYAAVPVRALPEAARETLAVGDVAAALFFSAETARHCVQLLLRARLHEAVRTVDALAIGKPAAVALQALPWRCIRVAARPTQDAMLALL
jgi:uroporphyrinogen-III synthase